MSKEYQAKQAALLAEHIKKQDIVITTALIPGRPAPRLISAEMARSMRPGSVIVDLAVERGGNCELAKPGEVVTADGVKIVGHLNVPGRLPATSSSLYAKNLYAFLEILVDKSNKSLAEKGAGEIVRAPPPPREGAVVPPSSQPGAAAGGEPHGARSCRDRSLRVPPVLFRARGVRRLLRGVVGHAGAAHAA